MLDPALDQSHALEPGPKARRLSEDSFHGHVVAPCFAIPGGPLVIVLNVAATFDQAGLRAMRGENLLAAPIVKVQMACEDGSQRILVAIRNCDVTTPVEIATPGGANVAVTRPARAVPVDLKALTEGLSVSGANRLIHQLIEIWPALFQLRDNVAYIRFCHRALKKVAAEMPSLVPEAVLTRHIGLMNAGSLAEIGDVTDVVILSSTRLSQSQYRPIRTRRGQSYLVLDRAVAPADSLVVILGKEGSCVRCIREWPHVPFVSWQQSNRSLGAQLRQFIQRSLSEALENDGSTAALLGELSHFSPMSQRNLLARKSPVTAAIDLLVPDGEGGVFLRGWVRDPHQLVVHAWLQFGDAAAIPVDPIWLRFPRPDVDKAYKGRAAAFGFVAHVGQAGCQRGQARFSLELGSGSALEILVRPTTGRSVDLRDAVLGSLPPERLTTDALERIIAPAAVPLHRLHLGNRQAPDIVQLGKPRSAPRYSVIIPLYRNLNYLRFQVGAFATDPEMARSEIIFVLDSPEQRADLVHFLSGLHQLYGMPMTIVVMSENFGYAAANNAGAALAKGTFLVLLNSDVVPEQSGWLTHLARPFRRRPAVLATGARLLFDDQSLQHAGMRFVRDAGGHWLNLHYHKGAPRDFAPALKARAVPAVTGAALMIRREAFQSVGGFTEDYIIGDYEDSDLCLKLRAFGGEVCYAPEAVLYHFERKSIARHGGYQRSVAGLYNRWLAGQRWGQAMQDLMTRFERRNQVTLS